MASSFDIWHQIASLWQATAAVLYHWQTLLAGSFAILAAWITVGQMRKEATNRRQRRLNASRAMMPNDLSAIVQYANDCVRATHQAYRIVRKHSTDRESGELERIVVPVLPERVFGNLQAIIEQADNCDIPALSSLLRCHQVQTSRLSGEIAYLKNPRPLEVTRVVTEDNILWTLKKTVELFLIASKMFQYSRGEQENIPPLKYSPEDLHNAFWSLGISDASFPEEYLEKLRAELLAIGNDS